MAATLAVALPSLTAAAALHHWPVVDGPVRGIVASDVGIAVVSEEGLIILDEAGQRLRRLPSGAQASGPAAPRRRPLGIDSHAAGSWSGLDLPADADWARQYDREEIDDADDPRLADEGNADPFGGGLDGGAAGGPPARAAGRATNDVVNAPGPPRGDSGVAMAAGGPWAWVGRTDGLWQIALETGAATRTADQRLWGAGVQGVAASGDGAVIVAARDETLYRSRDGGRTFEAVTTMAGKARPVVATGSGAVFFTAGNAANLWRLSPFDSGAHLLSLRGVVDGASCGGQVLLLNHDGLFRVTDHGGGGPVEPAWIADVPPGSTRIACGADGENWVVSGGDDVHSSRDGGHHWIRVARVQGPVSRVAFCNSAVWIGTASGLWRLSGAANFAARRAQPGSHGEATSADRKPVPVPFLQARAAPLPMMEPRWTILLPRVDLLFAMATTATRHDLRGLVVLTFSASGSAAAADASRRGGALLNVTRWDRARRAGQALGLATAADAGEDEAISVDERAATMRILEETTP